jgi:hypothetical protein
MFLPIHPQPIDLTVIASAFAASIYWVAEGKERKIRRQRTIRKALRIWVTIKNELKPVAPLLTGIEHVIKFIFRFIVPLTLAVAILVMSPIILLSLGLFKFSDFLTKRAGANPIATFFSWVGLALLLVTAVCIGGLVLISLFAQISDSSTRHGIEATIAILSLGTITFNLLNFPPSKLSSALIRIGLGWRISEWISRGLTYAALAYAWFKLFQHMPSD